MKDSVGRKQQKKSGFLLPGACSCMTLTSKSGKHYWFRTCDIETDLWEEGAHVVHRSAGEEIAYCDGRKEYSKYGYVGMTYNVTDSWLLDGVNEHGLAGGLLMLYEGTSVSKAWENRWGYVGMELVTKVLSSCMDVAEAVFLAEKVQILDIPYGEQLVPATMHYFFVDVSGNEVIMEAANPEEAGILRIYPCEEILGVMTNSPPYDEQLENLSWFLSQSPEMKQGLGGQAVEEIVLDGRSCSANKNAKHISRSATFPGSYCSYDRFIRLTVLKYLNQSGNEFEDEKMLALGSGIMNAVCEPYTEGMFHYTRVEADGKIIGQKESFTQYICMYDMKEKCFYQKKYDSVFFNKYML